jgi:hypothetical protein
MEAMAQLQTDVPHPLGENLPAFLSRRSLRDPAIRILLLVFIAEHGLEGSSMQVESNHIGRGESDLRQSCEEEFIDHPISCHPNWSGGLSRRMGSNDDSHPKRCPSQGDIGTVEESTAGSRFRMGGHFIRRLSQAILDGRQIEQTIVFATSEKAETISCQIDDHRKISILPIQSEDDPRKRKVLLGSIVGDDADDTEQISPIISVACACECREPLVRMRKQKRGPSPNDLTSFAS